MRKASETLAPDAEIRAEAPHPWVSRGGIKLAAALDAFGLDPSGLDCLDVGASTGGFTDVLLTRGARSVVRRRRRPQPVRRAPRGRSARDAARRARRAQTDARIAGAPQAIVCDVSFISQRLVLPVVLAARARPAWLVSLIKPQFEAGRENVVKGAVKDPAALALACEAVRACVEGLGWIEPRRHPLAHSRRRRRARIPVCRAA